MYYIFGKPSYVREREEELENLYRSKPTAKEDWTDINAYLDRKLDEIKMKKAEKRSRKIA